MPPAVEEHMITITLSPQVIAHHRIKGQLKLSFGEINAAFATGKGCIEFTNNGNVHYHLKTTDALASVYIFLDSLKGKKCQINNKRVPVYGFTKCDKTMNSEMIENYDYIMKNIIQTEQVLKKLRISEDYHACWDFTPKKASYNACYDKVKQCIGNLDRCISDTEDIINEIDAQKMIIEEWLN